MRSPIGRLLETTTLWDTFPLEGHLDGEGAPYGVRPNGTSCGDTFTEGLPVKGGNPHRGAEGRRESVTQESNMEKSVRPLNL